MEIVFVGTGGGRINLIKQLRGTGGFRINSRSADIHVDPGPGALVQSIKLKQDPLHLDAVIVSHNHIDHVSDAAVMIEGMGSYGLKRRGVLIASRNTLQGDDKGISSWHQSIPAEVYAAEGGEKRAFKTSVGAFEIEVIGLKHDEPSSFGFKLAMDGKVLGYITDTEYFDGIGESFSGCDCLIVSCIKPEADKYKGHLTSGDVIKILKVANPKKAVITHMGMKMLRGGPSKEAEKIQDQSGVQTVAARDGMKLHI